MLVANTDKKLVLHWKMEYISLEIKTTINERCFTTRDQNNNQWNKNCVQGFGPSGGWWHANCGNIAKTQYTIQTTYGIYLNDRWHALPFIKMKIRPHNCNI